MCGGGHQKDQEQVSPVQKVGECGKRYNGEEMGSNGWIGPGRGKVWWCQNVFFS